MNIPAFVTLTTALAKRVRPPHAAPRPRWRCTAVPSTPATPATPAASTGPRLRKGDHVTLRITRLAYGGASVGEITHPPLEPGDASMPVYAPKGACPGDVVRAAVTRVRRKRADPEMRGLHRRGDDAPATRSYAEAVFLDAVRPSPDAVQPACRHFGHFKLGGGGCGGCTAMHVPYHVQLEQKHHQMLSVFASLSPADGVPVARILPCEHTVRYRNKMEFSFGRRWHETPLAKGAAKADSYEYALGLHAPQRFDKIVHIDECHMQPPPTNDILAYVRRRSNELLLEPYDTKLDTGYMRNVAIRSSTNRRGEQELMVNIITSPCDVPSRLVPLAEELAQRFPSIVCVLQNIRGETSSIAIDESQERLLAGTRSYIEQTLCGLHFRISANSFFQTNPTQAEVLHEAVRAAARLTKRDTVLDLFCGTGTIGLCLARYAKQIYGIDVVPAAISDANVNARANNISNALFEEGNLDKMKKGLSNKAFSDPDVVVVDPPRAGLHPDLLKFLAKSDARRIVYVSCNPVSQVRDIHQLREFAPGRFRVSQIQPVDMFPNTHHVECVTTLERVA